MSTFTITTDPAQMDPETRLRWENHRREFTGPPISGVEELWYINERARHKQMSRNAAAIRGRRAQIDPMFLPDRLDPIASRFESRWDTLPRELQNEILIKKAHNEHVEQKQHLQQLFNEYTNPSMQAVIERMHVTTRQSRKDMMEERFMKLETTINHIVIAKMTE